MLHAEPDAELELMVRNNSAWLPSGALAATTADHVDHLRGLAPRGRTHYVDRSTRLGRKHPFREATLRVLAPERDTSSYYGRASGGRLTANAAGPATDGGEPAPYDACAADSSVGRRPGRLLRPASGRDEAAWARGSGRSTPPTTTPAW